MGWVNGTWTGREYNIVFILTCTAGYLSIYPSAWAIINLSCSSTPQNALERHAMLCYAISSTLCVP